MEDDMQRVTDDMARNMVRQLARHDRRALNSAYALREAEINDSKYVSEYRLSYEWAKVAAEVWRQGMVAVGVEPKEDVDTGEVLGAMVRRDGVVDFVALD